MTQSKEGEKEEGGNIPETTKKTYVTIQERSRKPTLYNTEERRKEEIEVKTVRR